MEMKGCVISASKVPQKKISFFRVAKALIFLTALLAGVVQCGWIDGNLIACA